jgi:diadenosine tetraphosphate (Ap4A) HIT family hydrolase
MKQAVQETPQQPHLMVVMVRLRQIKEITEVMAQEFQMLMLEEEVAVLVL